MEIKDSGRARAVKSPEMEKPKSKWASEWPRWFMIMTENSATLHPNKPLDDDIRPKITCQYFDFHVQTIKRRRIVYELLLWQNCLKGEGAEDGELRSVFLHFLRQHWQPASLHSSTLQAIHDWLSMCSEWQIFSSNDLVIWLFERFTTFSYNRMSNKKPRVLILSEHFSSTLWHELQCTKKQWYLLITQSRLPCRFISVKWNWK